MKNKNVMQEISISKIKSYLAVHFNFIISVYTKHNAKEDLEEGRSTFEKFISIEETNTRIKNGSQLYQLTINATEMAGIFEIDDNHLTLLYINDSMQLSGAGTFCIDAIKFLLKNKCTTLTVFASPYSLNFYIKNGFEKRSKNVQLIKGMRYYEMELAL